MYHLHILVYSSFVLRTFALLYHYYHYSSPELFSFFRETQAHGRRRVFFYTLFIFHFIYSFIYLFLAVLGLRCRTRAFSSCSQRGLLFIVVLGLPIVVASLVAKHGL